VCVLLIYFNVLTAPTYSAFVCPVHTKQYRTWCM